MMDESFVELTTLDQEKINGGFNPAFYAVAYGVIISAIPTVISAVKSKKK